MAALLAKAAFPQLGLLQSAASVPMGSFAATPSLSKPSGANLGVVLLVRGTLELNRITSVLVVVSAFYGTSVTNTSAYTTQLYEVP